MMWASTWMIMFYKQLRQACATCSQRVNSWPLVLWIFMTCTCTCALHRKQQTTTTVLHKQQSYLNRSLYYVSGHLLNRNCIHKDKQTNSRGPFQNQYVSARGRLPWLGTAWMFWRLHLWAEIPLIVADGCAATDHGGDVIKVLYSLVLGNCYV